MSQTFGNLKDLSRLMEAQCRSAGKMRSAE